MDRRPGGGVRPAGYRGDVRFGVLGPLAVWTEDGKPVRVTGLAMNVTGRRSADDVRRLLASIVSSSDDAIIAKDLEGRIVSWNRAAERMYGYSAAEAIGQSIAMLLPPDRSDDFFKIAAVNVAKGA